MNGTYWQCTHSHPRVTDSDIHTLPICDTSIFEEPAPHGDVPIHTPSVTRGCDTVIRSTKPIRIRHVTHSYTNNALPSTSPRDTHPNICDTNEFCRAYDFMESR